jgi:hypothetical protein
MPAGGASPYGARQWIASNSTSSSASSSPGDMHGWIQRLKTRVERTGFPLDDPMYRAVCEVEEPLFRWRAAQTRIQVGHLRARANPR